MKYLDIHDLKALASSVAASGRGWVGPNSTASCNVPRSGAGLPGWLGLLVLALLPLLPQATAAAQVLNPDFIDDSKPWEEMAASLPAFPQDENLVAFNVSSATANRYQIDTASVSVGEDRIIRYTIVIESPRGARTINFEGMRCDTAEGKIYAFGQSDGKWSENRRAKWEPFKLRSLLSYRKALYEEHFCPDGLAISNAAQGIRNLQRGGSKGLF